MCIALNFLDLWKLALSKITTLCFSKGTSKEMENRSDEINKEIENKKFQYLEKDIE